MVSIQAKHKKADRSGKKFQPPKLGKKRAVGADLKDMRREGLLDAARFLLLKDGLEAVSMQGIADLSKVAKGTLYLYFKTKEEMLLALLAREFRLWVVNFRSWIEASGKLSKSDISRRVVRTLQERQALLILMAHSESILEKNIGVEEMVAFKTELIGDMQVVARALAMSISADEEKLFRALLFIHAMVVGLYFKAFPNRIVKEALQAGGLQALEVDFSSSLAFMIEALLKSI